MAPTIPDNGIGYFEANPHDYPGLSAGQRRAIWYRDGELCGICGEHVEWAELNIDHVVEWREGGETRPSNLRATHRLCNLARRRNPVHPIVQRVCACGASFVGTAQHQYCSNACRQKAKRARQRHPAAAPARPEE